MVAKLGDFTLQQVANICANTSREACRFGQCPFRHICEDFFDIRVLVYNDIERGDLQREEYVSSERMKQGYVPGSGEVPNYRKKAKPEPEPSFPHFVDTGFGGD